MWVYQENHIDTCVDVINFYEGWGLESFVE